MTRRIFSSIVLSFGLVLAACSSAPQTADQAEATVPCGDSPCSREFGPPVTRYCVMTEGACDGIPIEPERVGGHLFAGVHVSGRVGGGN